MIMVSPPMSDLVVRRATANDVAVLSELIDGFAKGHPAESQARSVDKMQEAFFGNQPVAQVLLAEKNATAIGFGAWRRTYDVFWSVYGGDGIGLYVSPGHRRSGAALCIIAAMCAEMQSARGALSPNVLWSRFGAAVRTGWYRQN